MTVLWRQTGHGFAPIRIEGNKGFLRLRIAEDASLTMHAIGLKHVPKDDDETIKSKPLCHRPTCIITSIFDPHSDKQMPMEASAPKVLYKNWKAAREAIFDNDLGRMRLFETDTMVAAGLS